jgi:U3 small nucleolar RNA-associated protein 15
MFCSASDDTTVRLWDLVSQVELAVGTAHTDYVRCLAAHDENSFFSGSYDHTVALWDARTGLSAPSAVARPSHGSAVECVICIPEENLAMCGAGDVLTVFDSRKLTEPLHEESPHTKAITTLAYSRAHRTLISGSLDQRLKFLSLKDGALNVVAVKKLPHPITAVAIHPASSEFAVGTNTGSLNVFRMERREDGEEVLDPMGVPIKKRSKAEKDEDAMKEKIRMVRQQLLNFHYRRALQTALYSRMPDVILSTLEEIHKRGAMHVAVNGHNDRTVVQLLRFVVDRIDIPQLTELLFVVLDVILEIYGPSAASSKFFHRELSRAKQRLGESLSSLRVMEEAIGIMELIVNSD